MMMEINEIFADPSVGYALMALKIPSAFYTKSCQINEIAILVFQCFIVKPIKHVNCFILVNILHWIV